MDRRLEGCPTAADPAGTSPYAPAEGHSAGAQGAQDSAVPGPMAAGLAKSAEGDAHTDSAEARAREEHAARVARLADRNLANRARRERRRELRAKNQGDRDLK